MIGFEIFWQSYNISKEYFYNIFQIFWCCLGNLFEKTYERWWKFSHYRNITIKYKYCSKIPFIIFWTDIARFLQYFRNLSNSFINILAILQDFNGIFSKYFLIITVLCGYAITCIWSSDLKIVQCFILPHHWWIFTTSTLYRCRNAV